jgi:hypothetical protein
LEKKKKEEKRREKGKRKKGISRERDTRIARSFFIAFETPSASLLGDA